MKKLIVIGAYPNTPKKNEVLINQLNSLNPLKLLGFDFMLITHYPVLDTIQTMVDYYIYDKYQTLTPLDKTTYFWFKTDNFFIRLNNSRHALPISQSMNTAFKFSEIKNYDFVYFIENDNWFSKTDVIKLNELVELMNEENKKCVFFKPETYKDNGSYVYETQLFGVSPKYFNEVFKLPITEDEYFSNPSYPVSLELGFYDNLYKYENDFLIINQHSYEYFNNSLINIFRVENLLIELIHNIKNPDKPILFCYGNRISDSTIKIIIKINNEIINDKVLRQNEWSYHLFDLNEDLLSVEIYNNNILQENKTYFLNKDLLEVLKDKGTIEFN
jgi:hypothetical protein